MTKEHLHLASSAMALCCVAACSASPSPGVQTGGTPPVAGPSAPLASAVPEPPVFEPRAETNTLAPALVVNEVSAGERHACALAATGQVWCWGANDSKQVATTTEAHYASPVRINLPSAATNIAVGDRVSCALLSDGRRACWGYDAGLAVESAQRFDRLVSTWPANCALNDRRELVCGGYNYFGVLGFPIGERDEFQKSLPHRVVPLGGRVEDVAVAGDLGCALVGPESKLFCWGNGWGCSGPQRMNMPAPVTALSAGGVRVCLLTDGGDAYAFSELHELYHASDTDPDYYPKPSCHDHEEGARTPPSKIVEGATEISCFARTGSNCSACSGCIVDRQERVRCWQNDAELRGELVVPELVEGISHPKRIVAGEAFYCAVLESGLLQCWGKNGSGQLGRGHVSAVEMTPAEPTWPRALAPAAE